MTTQVPPEVVERARRLAGTGRRRLLGVAGAPGAGKSTLAAALTGALGADLVVVPMDGFHLAGRALVELGRAGRKGAPDTFDADGFVALLMRLRAQQPGDRPVWAPWFDRGIEEPVAGAVRVGAEVPLVLVEGNYLLHDDEPWARVAGLLDECWYVETDETVRLGRLVARHVAFGKEPVAAQEWALGPDQRNAELVAAGRARADLVVRL